MGIFQGDIIIKKAIELGMDDMRKNPWLIDHMLEDLTQNAYFADKYGEKQVEACKEWFRNAKIPVLMSKRKDTDEPPCIVVSMGPSPEKSDMKHMADLSTETVVLMPNQIGKPIPYIVKPFVPTSYDPATGDVGIPQKLKGVTSISPGMVLVNPKDGRGYPIIDVTEDGIRIEAGILDTDATEFGIVPQFPYFKARIEHTFFQETYNVSCHAHGDPQTLLWLWSITLYSILRYRESLLEANGFAESVVSSSDLLIDDAYGPQPGGGDEIWKRVITLTGQVENSWIKSPRRFIETFALKEKTKSGFTGGIKILSNLDSPPFIDKTNENWYTDAEINDDSEDDEDQNE